LSDVNIEADRKILSELHTKLLVDEDTDVEEEMKYFVEDTILIPPNAPPVKGISAIRAAVKEMVKTDWDLGDPGRGVLNLEISASGDLAYDVGRYKLVNKRLEGPVEERGYFVTLYKKIDGDWKFMGQIWNSIKSE
jgi:ketosteroid isomerase-like protein